MVARREFLALAGSAPFWTPSAFAQGAAKVGFQLSWIKSIQYGGYFAGVENGYYKDVGIEPVFNSGGPNIDAIANVATGQSGLGDRPSGTLVVAREKGIPIKIIATVFQRTPGGILSLAEKPLRTPKDFPGKTIALPASAQPLFNKVLRDNGIDRSAVKIVPVGTDPGILANGVVDGYWGLSTNQGVMLQTRGVKIHVLYAHDLGAPETSGTLYGTETFLKANRDLVVRFLRASIKAWDWALANPEKTADLMVNKHGAPGLNREAQLAEIRASKEFITAPRGLLSLDLKLFETMLEAYRSVDMLKSKMTVADLVDDQYINAALKG